MSGSRTHLFFTKTNAMMGTITNLGKYIFLIPFAAFGVFHLMNGAGMASAVIPDMPANTVLVYLSGAAQLAFVVSVLIGKYDKLAAILLALLLLLIVLLVHAGGLSGENAQSAQSMLLKDLGLMGGALMYAGGFAKDKSVVG